MFQFSHNHRMKEVEKRMPLKRMNNDLICYDDVTYSMLICDLIALTLEFGMMFAGRIFRLNENAIQIK